ncbi:MAG: OmpA family protein [Bacteroidota bacterium]
MKYKCYLLALLIIGLSGMANAQGSAKKLKGEGEKYFANEKYQEALNLLLKYQRLKPADIEARYKIGLAYYYTNSVDNAKRYLEYVVEKSKKPNPQSYYYLGRSYHSSRDYKKAIRYYKLYLKNIKSNSSDRASVKDAIRRCATGLRLKYREELAVVENLGDGVNTSGDEFGAVASPNYDNKLYFSSSRKGNVGGKRDKKGLRDEKYGSYYSDIYSTMIINGQWTATTPLSSLINSPRHDLLLDFNEDGSVMVFYKGNRMTGGEVLVDTFSNQADDRPLFSHPFKGPMQRSQGDNYPYFFSDTSFLFCSYRKGGLGGSDIYVATFRDRRWQTKNLGSTINSAYDEITPFLAKDGRTLYFSSNRRESTGGLDVFRSVFDDATQSWSAPINLASPINSPADDSHLRLSNDGLTAYFSSSRKEGYGQRDLYAAYFKSTQSEQLVESDPACFADVSRAVATENPAASSDDPMVGTETVSIETEPIGFTEEEIQKFTISPLFYEDDDDVMSSPNKRELDKVARLMQDFPRVDLLLSCHSDQSGPQQFALYFSIKRAEKVSQYLINNGIAASRIFLKGLGSSYPTAKTETEGGPNEQGARFNRRIDLTFFNTEGQPLQINIRMPDVSQFEDYRGIYYKQLIKGLSYKVQVAALEQRYNSEVFSTFPDPMIDKHASKNLYKYSLGLYKTFASASQLQMELVRQGIPDAYVVPFLNGLRISKEDARGMVADFPDLLNYLRD